MFGFGFWGFWWGIGVSVLGGCARVLDFGVGFDVHVRCLDGWGLFFLLVGFWVVFWFWVLYFVFCVLGVLSCV